MKINRKILPNINNYYSDNHKIDPSQGVHLGDGTINDGDRVEIGPTALAYAESPVVTGLGQQLTLSQLRY